MIELTGYARFILLLFGVMMLIGTITTPGVQWFASVFSGYLIGLGMYGNMPNVIKRDDE